MITGGRDLTTSIRQSSNIFLEVFEPSQAMPSSTLWQSCAYDGGLETSYTRVHGTRGISTIQIEE